MANQDLKRRIASVKNTQKTTKAMKMVSAAKLRRAQEAIFANRPYAHGLRGLMRELAKLPEVRENNDFALIQREDDVAAKKDRVLLLVMVTSDRGLCGGFNSSVVKSSMKFLEENVQNYTSVKIAYVGRKARGASARLIEKLNAKHGNKVTDHSMNEFGKNASFKQAKGLTDQWIDAYLEGEVDEIKIVYNEFKNAISQEVLVENFLPLSSIPEVDGVEESTNSMVLIKPAPTELFAELLEKNFAIQTYRILLESQAGEHGARMAAMDNATRNAGDMIRALELEYNKQRQAGITKELLEIIAGAESQNAG